MDSVALFRTLLEETWIESDPTRSARAYLQKTRLLLLEWHRAGSGGHEIVGIYTAMVDHLIRRLFEVASQDYINRYPSLSPSCALIAQGGYGRGELNPHSDIDLLFLHSWKITPYAESVAEKILYTLWDAGLQVGHATRSIPESIRLAGKDTKVKTSLLDARYLCGDSGLYGEFARAAEDHLFCKNIDRFVREKLEENRLRHERFGGSVYLLEPDIKEGEGGLRDIHTALWIARVKRKIKDLDELATGGVIHPGELSELKLARDFLLRVRNELHFSAGKQQDQLTFEVQERVALALGFKQNGGVKGVEAFMRGYYLHASDISRLASLIIHRCVDAADAAPKGRSSGREIRPGVRVARGTLWISDPGILSSDSKNLLQVFADAQKHGAEMSHETRELIRAHLHLVDDRFRGAPALNALFSQILKWKERVYETLMEMHRAGVLGSFIPEFGRLLCMVIHDVYHRYTVDQHSLRAIMELERLRAGKFSDALPLLTQLAREVEKIEILYLGLLFHDIGKGHGGGHSEIGSTMVRKIARRMRLNVDEATQLEFLVRHHLLMAHTAFQRDIEDEKLIVDFGRAVGNASNLKMLYLLTYADIRAVGPEFWSNWKASLLGDLYLQALSVLEELEKGGLEDRRSRARRIRARLRRRLSGRHPPERIGAFFETMPERYFVTTPEEEIPSHFELMESFRGQIYLSAVRHYPEREYSEMVICARDRPGLFARITGVFAAMGLDILSARITTRKDGLILDVFRISHGGHPEVVMAPEKWARVRFTLERVLSDAVDVARLVEESGPPHLFKRRARKIPTVIQIDNEASEDFTILEVYTQDRIGVLFAITYAMHQMGIDIHLAKISTHVDQVADIFYVTDERGGKIRDRERLERIRQTLYARLVEEEQTPDESRLV